MLTSVLLFFRPIGNLPYGEAYPATGAATIRKFLRAGGRLLSLGGRCFRQPLSITNTKPKDEHTRPSGSQPSVEIVHFNEHSVDGLAAQAAKGDQPATLTLDHTPDGQPALRVRVAGLQAYKYISFSTRNVHGYTVVHFRARGDKQTKHLCLEINEADGSRWKAVVALSQTWQNYNLNTSDFVSYATANRGDDGDLLRAARARRIAFGFPAPLVGSGNKAFEVSEIQWRPGLPSREQETDRSLLFHTSPDLIRAFGSALKLPRQSGDITAFFHSQHYKNAPTLRAAPNQAIFPKSFTISEESSGWTATILEDNSYSLGEPSHTHRGDCLPTKRLVRTVPLLVTPDGRGPVSAHGRALRR